MCRFLQNFSKSCETWQATFPYNNTENSTNVSEDGDKLCTSRQKCGTLDPRERQPALPFVAGVGETVRAVNAGRKMADAADDMNDVRRIASKIHGNSLASNKINYGYQLIDKNNNVVKYGESKNPLTRYTKKWLADNKLRVQIKVAGTKRGVHEWQHYMIENYTLISGSRPELNKSLW